MVAFAASADDPRNRSFSSGAKHSSRSNDPVGFHSAKRGEQIGETVLAALFCDGPAPSLGMASKNGDNIPANSPFFMTRTPFFCLGLYLRTEEKQKRADDGLPTRSK